MSSTKSKVEERMVLMKVDNVDKFKKTYNTAYFYLSDAVSSEGYHFVHATMTSSQIKKIRKDKNIKKYQLAGSLHAL